MPTVSLRVCSHPRGPEASSSASLASPILNNQEQLNGLAHTQLPHSLALSGMLCRAMQWFALNKSGEVRILRIGCRLQWLLLSIVNHLISVHSSASYPFEYFILLYSSLCKALKPRSCRYQTNTWPLKLPVQLQRSLSVPHATLYQQPFFVFCFVLFFEKTSHYVKILAFNSLRSPGQLWPVSEPWVAGIEKHAPVGPVPRNF